VDEGMLLGFVRYERGGEGESLLGMGGEGESLLGMRGEGRGRVCWI